MLLVCAILERKGKPDMRKRCPFIRLFDNEENPVCPYHADLSALDEGYLVNVAYLIKALHDANIQLSQALVELEDREKKEDA